MTYRHRRWLRLRDTEVSPHEIDDEFRHHMEMRIRELRARGLSADEATSEALRQFGDLADARAFCRAEDERRLREARRSLVVGDVGRDLTLAARTLRRQPMLASTTVVVLALAIAIATTAYAITHSYLIRPIPFPEPDRLVQVLNGPTPEPFPNAPSLQGVDWSVADSVFAERVSWQIDGFILAGAERPDAVYGAWVSENYFRVLGVQPALGRTFTPEEHAQEAKVAIISDAIWSGRYNRDPGVIGRAVRAHASGASSPDELVTIVGVLPPSAWQTTRRTDLLRPVRTPGFPSIARLRAGTTLEESARRLTALVRPQLGAVDPAWRLSLIRVQENYTRTVRPALLAMTGGAVFLLLIGAASVAAAQVTRAISRRAELGLRTALGASRGRLLAQLVTESFVIAGMASAIGAALAGVTTATLGEIVGMQLGVGVPGGEESLALGARHLAIVMVGGTLLATAFGTVAALVALRAGDAGLIGTQKGTTRTTVAPVLRRGLIVAQVAFTVMLLAGAGLMSRSLLAIGSEPLGFAPDGVIKGLTLLPAGEFPNDAARRQAIGRILASVGSSPGVRGAAVSWPHPFRGTGTPFGAPIVREGEQEPRAAAVQYAVSSGYFGVMGIPLLRGRDFESRDDGSGVPAVVVSAGLARLLWPAGDPIGRRIRVGADSTWRTIVGVVGDTREIVTAHEQRPDVYLPMQQLAWPVLAVLARVDGEPRQALPGLQRAVARVSDVLALADLDPLTVSVEQEIRRPRTLATLLGVFAALALGLAALGLYAALSYVVAQRHREIAIRMAIGADLAAVRRLVLGEGATVVATGLLAGVALSLALTRVIASQLYGVSAHDPSTFLVVSGVLGLVGLMAAISPLRRASRVQPAEVLRAE